MDVRIKWFIVLQLDIKYCLLILKMITRWIQQNSMFENKYSSNWILRNIFEILSKCEIYKTSTNGLIQKAKNYSRIDIITRGIKIVDHL